MQGLFIMVFLGSYRVGSGLLVGRSPLGAPFVQGSIPGQRRQSYMRTRDGRPMVFNIPKLYTGQASGGLDIKTVSAPI